MKKVCNMLLCGMACSMMTGLVSMTSVAAEGDKTVTVQMEGISGNLYYDTLEVPDEDGILTVAEVLTYADAVSDAITITGIAEGYITQVNDDVAGVYGGWDGWLYMVNGENPSVGMADYVLNDGDVVVLYYGDPYGVGMQYPQMDTTDLASGVIAFTSKDTTYGADGTPSVQTNPVTGMTVTIGTSVYTTDAAGKITLKAEDLSALPQKIQVEKIAENGCPLVLRFAPDVTLQSAEETGDVLYVGIVGCSVMMILSAAAVYGLKKRQA